jgi:hypothetical protein
MRRYCVSDAGTLVVSNSAGTHELASKQVSCQKFSFSVRFLEKVHKRLFVIWAGECLASLFQPKQNNFWEREVKNTVIEVV